MSLLTATWLGYEFFLWFYHKKLLLSTVYVLFSIYVVYLGLGSRHVLINIIFSPIFVANKTNSEVPNKRVTFLILFWKCFLHLHVFSSTQTKKSPISTIFHLQKWKKNVPATRLLDPTSLLLLLLFLALFLWPTRRM